MADEKQIETLINDLISEAAKNGGHVYVVDKKRNKFSLKLDEPITIHFYGGYKGDTNE